MKVSKIIDTDKRNLTIIVVLAVVFILDQCMVGFQLGNPWRFTTKTLLVPILIYFYFNNTNLANKLFLAGLVFSFFGNLLLLFKGGFIGGLCSFLIAHILYMLTFKKSFKQHNTSALIIISCYVIGLICLLYPNLGSLKIPVIIYSLTIGGMLYMAIGTMQRWLIIGAILFVASDSILAVNMFYKHSTISSLSVMFTYVLAQYFLVRGMNRNLSTPRLL